jgi:LDH2 family malate/lactate/ureidoglycolate dehydrogenase
MPTRVDRNHLREFVTQVLVRCGLDHTAAHTAAKVVCYADEHGFTTHGCNALANIYAPRLRDGRISAAARPVVVVESTAGAVIDGNGGLGLLAMTAAVDLAGRRAREHGVGLVLVRNSNHFGSAGYYSLRLARIGLVGLVMTNCGPQGVVPPLGGTVRMLGTNPISAAVPAGERPPFVLDMSTTVVATGKLAAARAAGQRVPPGWLLDRDGSDVTDPQAYYDGTANVAWLGGRLATGGAKGYGLGLLVDLLCGPLAGAAYGPRSEALSGGLDGETGSGEPAADTDVGHLALAIDPAAFGPVEPFRAAVDEVLGTVEACPPAGERAVTYPGVPEATVAGDSVALGVALPPAVVTKLIELAASLAVPLPAELHQEVLA